MTAIDVKVKRWEALLVRARRQDNPVLRRYAVKALRAHHRECRSCFICACSEVLHERRVVEFKRREAEMTIGEDGWPVYPQETGVKP